MGSDEAAPTPIVISREDDGWEGASERRDDSRVEVEKAGDGLAGGHRARVEDVARDDEGEAFGCRRFPLAAEGFDEHVEEHALGGALRVDVQIGEVEDDDHREEGGIVDPRDDRIDAPSRGLTTRFARLCGGGNVNRDPPV
jgi:hypothetical protein